MLWLIPLLPLLAAGVLALAPRLGKKAVSFLAVGSMAVSCILSVLALLATLEGSKSEGEVWRQTVNIPWFSMGTASMEIGWVLDPLAAVMAVIVAFVGCMIFLFSVGYMASDKQYARFFCLMSFFAAAMLGLVIANSLLLLFICWELVGAASYLLIGFWTHKPSAAAAAKKAFIVTRIGDVGFFIGMLWLSSASGTLLFYDEGKGCLETAALTRLGAQTAFFGLAVPAVITLLVLWGAVGKSGQAPLHVWLPDAMEGPTPVSALIHAATMVAAGIFLLARIYPLMSVAGDAVFSESLAVATWIGGLTALFGALVAVAQTDIKRILAYSTISQLGYMMLGLGAGGPAVAMFHLMTHAFFKALLFLGAGSVIHGCRGEQDIRRLGGLRKFMPFTFACYAVGMLALSGFPLLSGFWSKDAVLHEVGAWNHSPLPFLFGLAGAFLTAFYMSRQMVYVFFGENRWRARTENRQSLARPKESDAVMTLPLFVLAAGAALLGFIGTPAFPAFQSYLEGQSAEVSASALLEAKTLGLLLLSSAIALAGISLGWLLYRPSRFRPAAQEDPLRRMLPRCYRWAESQFFVDEFYRRTVLRGVQFLAHLAEIMDRRMLERAGKWCAAFVRGIAWIARIADEHLANAGFDRFCLSVRRIAALLAKIQNGRIQTYLKIAGASLAIVVLVFAWLRP